MPRASMNQPCGTGRVGVLSWTSSGRIRLRIAAKASSSLRFCGMNIIWMAR
ncbi:hypothetical protein D3C86_2026480 [compost metagenome]